jgi:hypothetical protein
MYPQQEEMKALLLPLARWEKGCLGKGKGQQESVVRDFTTFKITKSQIAHSDKTTFRAGAICTWRRQLEH